MIMQRVFVVKQFVLVCALLLALSMAFTIAAGSAAAGAVEPAALPAAANAVVGNGTPASCTEIAFDSTLAAVQADLGGVITFNCGGAAHTIDIYTSATIYTQVTIEGGDRIRLFAQGSAPNFVKQRFFEIATGGWLTLRHITLEGARGPAGDGWGSQGGSIVVWGSADPEERTGLELFSTTILNSASTAWGGAIANEGGYVLIQDSTLTTSSAKWGGAYNGANGTDLIVASAITLNSAQASGGGVRFWNSLDSQIRDSTISVNTTTAGPGGGVDNLGGQLIVRRSYLEDNSATSGGGIAQVNNQDRAASLLVENSRIAGNSALHNGGGIQSYGTVTVRSTLIRDNVAGDFGGGINATSSQVALLDTTLTQNQATNGGGLAVHAGGLTLTRGIVSLNQAQQGAGLYLDEIVGANANNWARITATTIEDNSAQTAAGAIFVSQAYVVLEQSAIYGNSAVATRFGAIYIPTSATGSSYVTINRSAIHANNEGGVYNGGTLLLSNSTISGNGGWGVWAGQQAIHTGLRFSTLSGSLAGQFRRGGGALTVEATVMDGSLQVLQPNCVTAAGVPAASGRDNWSGDGTCGALFQTSASLNLGPLALNGGTTMNHLPQTGSVLVDTAACDGLMVDQRGASRPSGSACDAGAIEVGARLPAQRVFLPMLVR